MIVCGAKEVESGEVSVRTRKGKDLGRFSIEDLISYLKRDILSRNINTVEE